MIKKKPKCKLKVDLYIIFDPYDHGIQWMIWDLPLPAFLSGLVELNVRPPFETGQVGRYFVSRFQDDRSEATCDIRWVLFEMPEICIYIYIIQ